MSRRGGLIRHGIPVVTLLLCALGLPLAAVATPTSVVTAPATTIPATTVPVATVPATAVPPVTAAPSPASSIPPGSTSTTAPDASSTVAAIPSESAVLDATASPGSGPAVEAVSPGPEPTTEEQVTWQEVDGAAEDAARAAALRLTIEQQLATIEHAITTAQSRAEAAGRRYEQAKTAAEQAALVVVERRQELATAEQASARSTEAITAVAGQSRPEAPALPATLRVLLQGQGDVAYRLHALERLGATQQAQLDLVAGLAEQQRAAAERAAIAVAQAEQLQAEAATARDQAAAEQAQLQAQLASASEARAELQAMLTPLQEGRAPTEADYQAAQLGQRLAAEAASAVLAGIDPAALSAAGFAAPLAQAAVTDGYGWRLHPVFGDTRMHWGTDFVSDSGTCGAPLFAVAGGTVLFAGPMGGYGNHVVVDVGGGTEISYSHLAPDGIGVQPGQLLAAGQAIGIAGTTGTSTGCHLHFEVTVDGQHVDPLPWLAGLGL